MTAHVARWLFVGSYTDGRAGGIYTLEFDGRTDALRVMHEGGHAPNPSFIVQRGRHLYAAHELETRGCLAAYEVLDDGSLACRGACSAPAEAGTCFVAVDPNGRCLYGANYVSGSLACCMLSADGWPSGGLPAIPHQGSSANSERQASAHVHSIFFVPGADVLAAVDLGIDEVVLYRTEACGALERPAANRVVVPAGSGPRMLAFRPGQRLVALVDELANNVRLFRFDAAGLAWEAAGVLELTDALTCDGRAVLAAHPAFSPDGRRLYVSVRGLDVIVAFELDEADAVIRRAAFPSGGRSPRHFSLSPDGKLLAVANQDSNSVVMFAVDTTTGELSELTQLAIPHPSCVIWS